MEGRKVKSYVQDILWECHWKVQQMSFKNVGNPVCQTNNLLC